MKKFIKSKILNDYEILTDDGWVDIIAIHKTIKYFNWIIKTKNKKYLECADTHIVFDENMNEIFIKKLKLGNIIQTDDGPSEIISIEKTNEKINMYDLELSIDSKRRYYTNGILSHNTMYLRYLVSILSSMGRSLIYIPPNMVDSLSNPEFLPLLANNPNSILIIEDSENALQSRDSGNMAVTNLLSLADGLLSDSLNMQIIATFNTKLENIDKAILREGRLIINHEFKPLNPQKSTELSKHIGANKKYAESKTLAEIYNYNKQKSKNNNQKPIGFNIKNLIKSEHNNNE